MSPEEMSNMMDVLYNNITSNQAPGLDEYEKSVFLTKAQQEILKNYFNPKGNKYQEGFDGSQKRQIDFSKVTKVASVTNILYSYTKDDNVTDKDGKDTFTKTETPDTSESYLYTQAFDANNEPIEGHYVKVEGSKVTGFGNPLYDNRQNSKSASLPSDILMIINERLEVKRNQENVSLVVKAISFEEYDRLMSKPFKRPLKNQAWRLINNNEANKADLIVGPIDSIQNYTIRYVKRPLPIITSYLEDLKIDGYSDVTECELDPILHDEIVQRAVELAKIAWTQTGQDNTQAVMQTGQRSE